MKNRFRSGALSAFIVIFFSVNVNLFSQISIGGNPYSFTLKNLSDAPTTTMEKFDVNVLLREDSLDAIGKDVPFRFGKPFEVNLNLNNSGVWDELPNGDKIWRLRISSPGAYSINLIYNDFWLPEGAKLYLYNDDRSHVIGAFTEANNKETGKFATRPVTGDAITLEYIEPANVVYSGKINISSVIHAYRDIFKSFAQKDFGGSGSCNNNVNCPVGADWQNEKRAVAMVLLSGGTRWCSGALVNNVNVDLKQYFLTANHCLGASDTWIFMFNYESPTCDNVDGPTNFSVQGSTLLASNDDSDFGLLEITEPIPSSYEVHWAGWSNIDVPSTHSTGIHHPDGDIKKISFDYDPSISAKYLDNQGVADSHWKIAQWDDGTTEPGSSGSPLFDQNHRIIGQLHGGWASCTSLTADYYGKFAMSWDRGTTASTRLKDWLDPNNTGAQTLDGWDPTVGDPDDVPPTAITDLSITNQMSNRLTITWTAPLDTSYNGVISYVIKMSESPIDNGNFDVATTVPYSDSPKDPGQSESLLVENLAFATTYYFAIKSTDFWDNISDISNVPSDATLGEPSANVTPTSLEIGVVNPDQTWNETVTISNAATGASTLDYSAELANNTFPAGAVKIGGITSVVQNIVDNNIDYEKGAEPKINGQSLRGSGGPDTFGYRWKDSDEAGGPVYEWADLSNFGTEITFTGGLDDGYSSALNIGFNFNFYGVDYTQVSVSTNGFVYLGGLSSSYRNNSELPDPATPNKIIAAFWDDLDGRTNGVAYYKAEADRFIIQFTDFQKWESGSSTGNYTFQIILKKSGAILIHYKDMTGTLDEATVGIENETGTDGLQVTYNAAYPPSNEFSLLFYSPVGWVDSDDFGGGTLFNGSGAGLILNFDSSDLELGDYSIDLIFTTTDPNNPTIVVPITMTVDIVPVELTSFTAENTGNGIALSWITGTETNNKGFDIQRSDRNDENAEWQSVGFVEGKGTTSKRSEYGFVDNDKNASAGKLFYRLKQIDYDGKFEYSQVLEVETVPTKFALEQNFPNPFNPSTKIKYALPTASAVRLSVFNILGEEVAMLVNKVMQAGYHEVSWSASQLPSGIYIYRIQAVSSDGSKNYFDQKKMLLIK
ncbi:MAG: T9SS type A sorting domain-containing protein [Chlorobi bacterium]|nr:T9SS type A sorting domain-containing protein [Chlorobiota bacterium]